MDENIAIDENGRWGGAGVTNDSNAYILNFRMNPALNRLICEAVVTSSNTSIGSTIPGLTQGSVLFGGVGGTLAQDNANFFWDDTNNRLGLGTNTPAATLHIDGSVEFDLGADNPGDIYYRDNTGLLINLGIGSTGDVLTVSGGFPLWTTPTSFTGYNQIQDDGVNINPQRQILNFVDYFTVTDDAGNASTDVSINVTELANDSTFVNTLANNSTFIDDLIANTYFTTNLANDNNFITTLTSNTTFQGDIVTIINNAGPTLQIDLTTQVTGILPVPNGGTGAATLTGVLHGNGTSAFTAIPLTTDGAILIGDGSGEPTTLAAFSSSTGNLKLANGGTGSSLSDPGANKLWGWDDTDNSIGFWTIGTGLSYDHASHTLSSTGSGFSQTSISQFEDFLGVGTITLTTGAAGVTPHVIGPVLGILGWSVGAGDNATVTCAAATATSGRPGLVTVTVSANDTGYIVLGESNTVRNFDTNNEYFGWDPSSAGSTNIGPMNQGNWSVTGSFKLGSTANIKMQFGFSDISQASISNGIYFELDTGVDTNWRGTTYDGTAAQTVTTVAADTNYHKFEIIMNAGGTSVEFLIDGSSLGSLTTHIPSAGGRPFFLIESLTGATKAFTTDYWLMNQTVASR